MNNDFREEYKKNAVFVNALYERLSKDESWESDPERRLMLTNFLRFCIECFAQ